MTRSTSRLLSLIVVAGTCCGHAALAADAESVTPAPLCGSGPLDILLTNDDGVDAPGIRALYAQLRAAGHRVILVAPSANASGTSTSFTWGSVQVRRDPADANIYGVTGTPATAVVLGATALYPPDRRPDLVISGINDGANAGSLLALSGTIGAALAGTIMLERPVPGFAVNADRPATPEARQALPGDHLDQVGRHLARLVDATRGWFCDRGRVVRPTVVLNVNYPAQPAADWRGVRVARQGRSTDLHIRFEAGADGAYASRRSPGPVQEDFADSDTTLLAAGFVTVTPIEATLERRDVPVRDLQHRLGR